MGVPTWEVGYTSAMPRKEDHEVRQGHVGHWIKKYIYIYIYIYSLVEWPRRVLDVAVVWLKCLTTSVSAAYRTIYINSTSIVVYFLLGVIPWRLNVYSTYEDGTELSETSEHKIQTPGNPTKEKNATFRTRRKFLSHSYKQWISSLHGAFRKITSTINQQMHLHNFHLKHFKTLKSTPTCFDLFRSSSGNFVVPC